LSAGFAADLGAGLGVAGFAAGLAAGFGAGCAVCARADPIAPTAITAIIKVKNSTRHIVEWFPQYCDWKMARADFVPRQE
jgi:hypothetical protein